MKETIKIRSKTSSKSMSKILNAMVRQYEKYSGSLPCIKDINFDDINGFRYYLLNEATNRFGSELSKNSASSYFNAFKNILHYAYKSNRIDRDLSIYAEGIPLENPPRQVLSSEELKKLLNTNSKCKTTKNIAYISLTTGLRWSDIVSIKKGQIKFDKDLDCYILSYRQQKTKELNSIPLSQETYECILELIDSNINDLEYHTFYHRIKSWFKVAGVSQEKSFMHIFRHTFATLQIKQGTDIYTVQNLLGHKSINTTQIYAKADLEKKKNAILNLKF